MMSSQFQSINFSQQLQQAVQYHQQGQLAQAETLYRTLLQIDPRNSEIHHLLGLIAQARHDYALAVKLIKKAIRLNPKIANYHSNLGMVWLDQGEFIAAYQTLQTAAKLAPQDANIWHNLGNVCYQQGQLTQALPHYQRALKLAPNVAKFHNNLGNIFSELKRFDEAIACFQQAIKLQPQFAEAYNNWGATLKEMGKLSEAVVCFQTALQWQPHFVAAYHNLGLTFKALSQLDLDLTTLKKLSNLSSARACWQQILTFQPNHAESYQNLGDICRDQKQFAEAVNYYQRALALNPQLSQVYNNLGMTWYQQHQLESAAACYQQALALNPSQVETHYNLGNLLVRQGQFTQALASFQRALALDSNFVKAYNNLGMAYLIIGEVEAGLKCFDRALTIDSSFVIAFSNLLFALHYSNQYDNATIFAKHQQFNQQYVVPLTATLTPPTNDPTPQRRLKIGYLSGDFHRHSVAYFIEAILAHHDQSQFEICCYHNNRLTDEVTQRLQSYAHQFTPCEDLTEAQLVAQIRQDGIDILIDLAGHFSKNRLLTLARQPAPIQISYLGYSDTTGVATIDYRITDNYVEPVGIAEAFSSETLLRMSPSYFCYRPYELAPPVNDLPAKINGYLTFGSFNHLGKLSPEIVSLWGQLLRALPQAKLLIKTQALDDLPIRIRLQQQFADLGISPDRLILSPYIPNTESHLQLYHQIDIALDSFPYNGATTTCEALWMGIPVITLVGTRHTSRMGLSILSTVGLTDWIAYTPTEYIQIAVQRSSQLDYLPELRQTMRTRLQASPLLDGVTFTHQLETIYRQVWTRWCELRVDNFQQVIKSDVLTPRFDNFQKVVKSDVLTPRFDNFQKVVKSQEWIGRAWQYHQAGNFAAAEAICTQVLTTQPQHSGALHLKGLITYQTGQHSAGIELLQQARQLNPTEPYLHSNLGIMLSTQNRITETIACYQQALTLFPDDHLSHNNLGKELYLQHRLAEALTHFQQALRIQPHYPKAHSNLLMTLNYLPDDDPVKLFEAHCQFEPAVGFRNSFRSVTPRNKFRTPTAPARIPTARLKIGYVSPDFKRHSVAYFIEAILAHHDRQQFEIFCYYNHSQFDEVTHRLQTYVDHFLPCESLSDEQLVAQIQQDQIDLLIDLAGHTAGNRLPIFIQQPAPVQITYLGYSGTTGLSTIDYRITDAYADPIGTAESVSSEQLIRMSTSYFCYSPEPTSPPVSAEPPALRHGYITFGSFNNYAKLSSPLIELWVQLLNALPTAHLLIKAKSLNDAGTRSLAKDRLIKLGIPATRLTLIGHADTVTEHFHSYSQVDIALDSFPYNGATTTCETLWMGVPVVTLVGKTHVARMGLSILTTVGLPELIAHTPAEYLQISLQLANNWSRLQTWRQSLRAKMQQSPLMQGESFTRELEGRYRDLAA